MSLEANLDIAQAAITNISKLGIISENKISHRLKAAGGIQRVIGTNQGDRTGQHGVAGNRLDTLRNMNDASLRQTAGRAVLSKSGNCGELAMVAAIHMIDTGGSPIHLMWFTSTGYDHMWATIGVVNGWQPNNLRSWGDEAVWVDPWQTDGGIAFTIKDFIAGRVRNLNAIYKCDSVTRVEAGGINGVRVDV